MPGDDLGKIRKATTLGVDCICMDFEDGVAPNRKSEARNTVIEAMNSLDFHNSERLVRINAVGSGFESDDLKTALPLRPDGIVIPKVDDAHQIHLVSQAISSFETQEGWSPGGIRLIVVVESARAIVNLPLIVSADLRLDAIIFGAEDFASDLGAIRTKDAWEVFYARSAVVTYASAHDLQAIDMVYIDFQDIEGLKREAIKGAQMAFSGKQVIHPNQVAPVQEAFTPSNDAIDYAVKVISTFKEKQLAGIGAFALNGRMIDAPIVKHAERVITLAKAAGKIPL